MEYEIKTTRRESLKLTEDSRRAGEMKVSIKTISFTVTVVIVLTISFGYIVENWSPYVAFTLNDGHTRKNSNFDAGNRQVLTASDHTGVNKSFDDADLRRDINFDVNQDVFVPLYIQKTGMSSLVSHIITDSDIKPRCQFSRMMSKRTGAMFRCVTKRESTWLLSPSTGSRKCGLYPDWTAITQCTVEKAKEGDRKRQKRKYHYITMLRDPVKRFISEHMALQRNHEYFIQASMCNGDEPEIMGDVRTCYVNVTRVDVTLERFMACRVNHAINRQTRMLADLRLVNCYNHSGMAEEERDRILLASAKRNLLDLSFFGLTEYQHLTRTVFERTFNIKFLVDFKQFETLADTVVMPLSYLKKIEKVNHNDMELYDFAKSLFFQRVKQMGIRSDVGDRFTKGS